MDQALEADDRLEINASTLCAFASFAGDMKTRQIGSTVERLRQSPAKLAKAQRVEASIPQRRAYEDEGGPHPVGHQNAPDVTFTLKTTESTSQHPHRALRP